MKDSKGAKLVREYEKGKTLMQLANEHNVSVTLMRNYLLGCGATMRPRGRRPSGN